MQNELAVPTIATNNLRLSPLLLRHSKGMFDLWSSPAVCRYSGVVTDFSGVVIPTPVKSAAESNRIIDFFLRHQKETGKGFRWALTSKDESVFYGALGFNSMAAIAEIAYHLHPDYWGKGIMSEACQAAIAWLKLQRGADGVEAFIDSANFGSIALVKRLSFKSEGEMREGVQRYILWLKESHS